MCSVLLVKLDTYDCEIKIARVTVWCGGAGGNYGGRVSMGPVYWILTTIVFVSLAVFVLTLNYFAHKVTYSHVNTSFSW